MAFSSVFLCYIVIWRSSRREEEIIKMCGPYNSGKIKAFSSVFLLALGTVLSCDLWCQSQFIGHHTHHPPHHHSVRPSFLLIVQEKYQDLCIFLLLRIYSYKVVGFVVTSYLSVCPSFCTFCSVYVYLSGLSDYYLPVPSIYLFVNYTCLCVYLACLPVQFIDVFVFLPTFLPHHPV